MKNISKRKLKAILLFRALGSVVFRFIIPILIIVGTYGVSNGNTDTESSLSILVIMIIGLIGAAGSLFIKKQVKEMDSLRSSEDDYKFSPLRRILMTILSVIIPIVIIITSIQLNGVIVAKLNESIETFMVMIDTLFDTAFLVMSSFTIGVIITNWFEPYKALKAIDDDIKRDNIKSIRGGVKK